MTAATGLSLGQQSDGLGLQQTHVVAGHHADTHRVIVTPGLVEDLDLGVDVGSISIRGGFNGWNLAETYVLNRYRKRAI
ncbi:hypothetical protein A5734_11625 [Mycolicibacterium fortuitum]|nr:hypothetical protein A5734_11625 [Mycolicibacterium fortuitum]